MSHEDDVVELTRRLVGTPSENPPGEEAGVADLLERRLDASPVPFDVERYDVLDDRPNVVARAGNPDRGSVLLTGHMDVVPAAAEEWTGDPYELREVDGRLVGRGVSDMKGALAAKLVAAERYLLATDDPGEVVLAFVADEEWGGRGTEALVERGVDADAAVIGEPTELQVCVAQKGVARYRLTVRGRSCHSGRPDEGVDAIAGLRQLLAGVASLDEERRAGTSHPLLAPETVTATEVEGGSAPNVVAGEAAATVDWRFLPGPTNPEPFDDRIDELVGGLTHRGDPVAVDVERTVFARAGEVAADHELVTELQAAGEEAGLSVDAVGFDAATDARFLLHDAEIPTVLFGPGSIHTDAHTVDESVDRESLVRTVEVYERALDRLLS